MAGAPVTAKRVQDEVQQTRGGRSRVRLPRRRRPWLIVLAALIVALAAWANVVLVNRLDDRVEVLSVVRTVPAFERITDADLGVARIADDPALWPVPASERASVVGKVAAVELRPGSLVVREQVTEARPPFPGQQLVGLAVKPGQMPGGGVAPGDMVLVVIVASEQPGSSAVPGGDGVRAQVVRVGQPSSDGSVTVDVVVSAPNGPPLASASSAGRVALVLLPRGG